VSLINGVKLGPEGAEKAQLDATTFMISAQQNDGIIDLKNYLISLSRPKEWVIPKDKGNTLLTPQERVEQIVLEMLLDHTHEEIPYVADIECLSLKPAAPGSTTRLRIDVNIIVDTGSQERIIVGHQGRTLVKIRASAVEVLEEILGKDVLLFLWVKSREGKNEQN
jgi:GTP-binding protein Era